MAKSATAHREDLQLAQELENAIAGLEATGAAEEAALHVACESFAIAPERGRELLILLAEQNRNPARSTGFTPGPWIVFHADADGANDVLPAMRPGCIAREIENAADASLIAAAPDLLMALQLVRIQLRETLGEDRRSRLLRDKIDAAISKATTA